MTTLGDLIYGGASGVATRLAGQTTIIKEYLSQTGNGTISAAPVWAQINYADITGTTPTPPSGTVLWSALGNAGSNLSLSNAAFTTTFNQTSAVAWLWANTQAAVSGTAQSSPLHELAGSSWSGAAAVTDTWTTQNVCASSTTVAGTSELKILHTGTTGSYAVDVAKVTFVNGTTGGPFVQGGYGFDGTKATGSSTPDMICGEGSGAFSFVPSSSTSVNVGTTLRLYSNAGTTTNSPTWSISTGQNNTAGNVNLIVQAGLNASGSIMTHLVGPGTYAGRAAFQFGAVPSGNAINFSATSGSQVCMAIGGITAGSVGSVQFNPASGTATFTGLNIAPIINQTSSASGNYTALNIAVTETSLKGTANLLINASAGTAGTTSVFSVNNCCNLNLIRSNTVGIDQAGTATITAAATSITVTYATNYTGAAAPVVVVTPTSDPLAAGVPVGYWVVATGSTTAWTGFTINIQSALASNVVFNYIVLGKA